MLAATKPQKL